jgi:hypothetical protein
MARSEYVYLKGKAKWFRHTRPDEWGNWKHDIYLDDASVDLIRELQLTKGGVSGIKNVLKKDEDGYYMSLRRPTQKIMKGKVVGFQPPEVLDGATTLPDGSNPPLRDTTVGNGSDITTKCMVYQHPTPGGGQARAMRWESTRIDNLVPYEGRSEFTEQEAKMVDGLIEQPKPKF